MGRGRRSFGFAVAMAATLALACDQGVDQRSSRDVAIGHPAPAYAARTLGGDTTSLAGHRGQVVLLNIWATWCKPCRTEIPALETLHQRHQAAGLAVVGVSIDVRGDSARIASFADELGASYALWHDADDIVSTTFLSIGVPSSYLIGRDGTLRWRHVGPVTADDSSLNAALTTALGEPPGP
jgi:peroxiredoxin